MVSNPSNRIKTEAIDEVILGLLGLKPGAEIYYQTYFDILKKKLAIARLGGRELPQEEDNLLREELKRIRRIKDKAVPFRIKKSKVKTSGSTGTGPSVGYARNGRSSKSSAIVKAQRGKLVPQTITINSKEVSQISQGVNFDGIKKTLNSILGVLASKFKFDQKQSDTERKEKETEKRGKGESTLEGFKKGVGAIVATTKKMLSPFQAIIDRIWRFVFFTLLGRAFTKFMEWMSDKENQKKFNSFIEFLSDHWPALAGLYILFGTGFGKLVRGLLKGVTRMIIAIGMNIPKLIRFIKNKPRLAGLFASVAALGTGYLSREVQNLFGDKETPESGLIPRTNPELNDAKKSVDQSKAAPAPKIPAGNLGGLIPSFKMGGFNPYGGMNFQQGVPITGAGQDDTLIAAKTGEAILTEKDQQDIGQRYIDRNTGEPLSIPQYLSGRNPRMVSMNNIRPRFGGGFSLGGMIPGFNAGGMVGMQGGGWMGDSSMVNPFRSPRQWYNLGRNVRIPNENTAGWRQLIRDDLQQVGKFKTPTGYKGFNPFWSFTKGLGTGPTPIQRQLVERGIPRAGLLQALTEIQGSTPQSGPVYERMKKARGVAMSKYAARTGQFGRYQNGGLISQGPFTPLSSSGHILSLKGLKSGGLINENTGMNIPGATADRQLINVAVQPGESKYIFTRQATQKGAVGLADLIQAKLDPNSAAAKRGYRSITPYRNANFGGMMTLPPITQMSGGSTARASGYAGGSRAPSFSAIPMMNDRDQNASWYGINNLG